METLESLADFVIAGLCTYIASIAVIRLTMMSIHTHRKAWILIYFCAGASAAWTIYLLAENAPHWRVPALLGYLHITLWFHESRLRWMHRAPPYMSISCPHLGADEQTPPECPLGKERSNGF
jgi:hypothetical protein